MFAGVLCITWPYSIETTQMFCEFSLILYNLNNPLCAFLYVSENLKNKGFSTFAWTRAWELWLHIIPGEVQKFPEKLFLRTIWENAFGDYCWNFYMNISAKPFQQKFTPKCQRCMLPPLRLHFLHVWLIMPSWR